VKERLIRNILQKATAVFDNVQVDATPIKYTVKAKMIAWLRRQQGVTCGANTTELQLHKLIKLQMPEEKPYGSFSQTVVRGPQVVLGFCPCGPFRLKISPKRQKK